MVKKIKMEINKNTIVGDVVADNYKAATVFSNYKIDFCCNGNRSLETVCAEKELSLETLMNDLEDSFSVANSSDDYKKWDIGFLADYVYNNHHIYVENKIPEIKQYLTKICSVHGAEHPELFKINDLFVGAAGALTQHMKKEELILFPYFKKLAIAFKAKESIDLPGFGSVQNPISVMHQDHDTEGDRFREISRLTNDYTPPAGACNSYKATFAMLKEFEADLHKHIHIENNILFKKAIEIEAQLLN